MKVGGAGYRSRYLSHAKRALYHLSYAPFLFTIALQMILSCVHRALFPCSNVLERRVCADLPEDFGEKSLQLMPTGSEGVPIYYNNSRDQDICRVSRAFLPRLPECQYLRQVLTSSFQQSIPFKNCCLQRSGTLWDCHIVPLLQIWCLTPKAIQNVYKNVSIADIRCQQNSLFNHCIPHKFAHHGAKVFINSCCILE